MNILLVSECTKNALKETRRVIDQFAERTGQRTWQTAITDAGLKTVHQLLRKTARRNTAVACFWTRGKNRTELLWIVGDRTKFNEEGRVPTSRTKRNILRSDDENSWKHGTTIQILATLAALLHDMGKATIGFQDKLKPKAPFMGDPYRHEWISLHLFLLMIEDCKTNKAVLERLANFEAYRANNPNWHQALDEINRKKELRLDQYPPIVQTLSWLIMSHHRMHFPKEAYCSESRVTVEREKKNYIDRYLLDDFYGYEVKPVSGWVQNKSSDHPNPDHFWQLKEDITQSSEWQKNLTRWANRALRHEPLMKLGEEIIQDPLVFYLSRMALIVGDHNYSSYDKTESDRVAHGDKRCHLIANTDRKTQEARQKLDQHLIGVARLTASFAYRIPYLSPQLLRLKNQRSFAKRTTIDRFKWQNSSYDLARSLSQETENSGFFGINMASTGCGKTIGNARIMYALADEKKGARFTIALGLRTLTMQTGSALRKALNLDDESLAVLVGGTANRALFNLAEKEREENNVLEKIGSESLDEFLEGNVDVSESGISLDRFQTLIADPRARQLITTPIISCTIDHLMNASESRRGGSHIVPIIRLLTSDLILDEPDDFSQEDLPTLARLVYLSGLFGSRVLLSSATLTPDLIEGLFRAYRSGRAVWQRSQSNDDEQSQETIVTAWFDEFNQDSHILNSDADFKAAHQNFVEKRVKKLTDLRESAPKRKGELLHVSPLGSDEKTYQMLASSLIKQADIFHKAHHTLDEKSGKKVSVGLIRIAHIKDIVAIARAIYRESFDFESTQIHLALYHSRQLMFLRNRLEEALDRILDRSNPHQLFEHPEIRERIETSDAINHIFIVLGSPVTEVGRDHDYDWGIIDPSSMRSIIQLVGRIWRHRDKIVGDAANVAILSQNIQSLRQKGQEARYCYPGFEMAPHFLLDSHQLEAIIRPDEISVIDSIPRIERPEIHRSESGRYRYLSDLEHAVMKDYLNNDQINFVNCFYEENLAHHLSIHQRIISPFRRGRQEELFVCQPDENQESGFTFRRFENAKEHVFNIEIGQENELIKYKDHGLEENLIIKPWLNYDFNDSLEILADRLGSENLDYIAFKYAQVSLELIHYYDKSSRNWRYHPWIGFWED